VAHGVCGSKPLMVADEPEESLIPSSPVRSVRGVGSAPGGKWSGDLTRC
jgi:hypothetical protein